MGVSADASVRVWTRLFGTSSADAALDLGVGLDGAVYLAGYSNGSLDGQTYSGSGDAFLTKYGADGIKAWSRLLGTSASDIANALTRARQRLRESSSRQRRRPRPAQTQPARARERLGSLSPSEL